MKTIIISDIHDDFITAESIIDHENPDKIIFLGDYFDSIGSTIETADCTANWLKESIAKPNRIHLAGNHDIPYMARDPNLRICSGFTVEKRHAIQRYHINWYKLCPWYFDSDWLFTHAGLSADFFPNILHAAEGNNIIELLQDYYPNVDKIVNDKVHWHPWLQAGHLRGGDWFATGGPIWCDYQEFHDIGGLNQIFGHTRGYRHNIVNNAEPYDVLNNETCAEHYNIDMGLEKYLVMNRGEIIVKDASF